MPEETEPTPSHRHAGVVSVGDELTLGQTLDTNSRVLSTRLSSLGIPAREHVTVPDDLALQTAALRRLAGGVDVVVCTGGLGPTADDLTRAALAGAMDDTLVEDPMALGQIEAWYASRGRPMPALNRTQALRPSRAVIIPNLHGTAPGLFGTIRAGGRACDVFCLPGPPGEMIPMFEAGVVPRLRPPAGRTVRTRVLHCFGIGESDLATRLGELMDRDRVPLVGTTASGGVVSCRLRYEGPLPADEADELLAATAGTIRAKAAGYVFGEGDDDLARTVLSQLRAKGETLGTVESCTGGLVGQMLTAVPGSSAAYVGGMITYANEIKTRLAGVSPSMLLPPGPGAVSEEAARAMATGGLERLGCTHCVAITGIAGPDGAVPARHGRPAKPVGTVFIARAADQGGRVSVETRQFRMSGDRGAVRDWSARSALAMLWQHLAGVGQVRLMRQV